MADAEFLPGVRLVRAFNAIGNDLKSEAHRAGTPIAIPLAGDDAQALAVAQQLVRDAGFEPVVVGPLARAREFDVGTALYTRLMTAAQLRKALGLKEPAPPAAAACGDRPGKAIEARPARRAHRPDGHGRTDDLRIIQGAGTHEQQVRSRFGRGEQVHAAGRTEAPMHDACRCRRWRIVAHLTGDAHRLARETDVHGAAAGADVLADAAPAGARDQGVRAD